MRITLISQELFNELNNIKENHPTLTYKAKGYDEPKITEQADIDAHNRVADILRAHIDGFSRFQNFTMSKDGDVRLRFQYNYSYDGGVSFTGVGYIDLNELLNGFKNNMI